MTEEQTLVIQESMASAWAEEDERFADELGNVMGEIESSLNEEDAFEDELLTFHRLGLNLEDDRY